MKRLVMQQPVNQKLKLAFFLPRPKVSRPGLSPHQALWDPGYCETLACSRPSSRETLEISILSSGGPNYRETLAISRPGSGVPKYRETLAISGPSSLGSTSCDMLAISTPGSGEPSYRETLASSRPGTVRLAVWRLWLSLTKLCETPAIARPWQPQDQALWTWLSRDPGNFRTKLVGPRAVERRWQLKTQLCGAWPSVASG